MTVTTTPSYGTPLRANAFGAVGDVEDEVSAPMHDAVVRAAFALLTPEKLAEVVASRVMIEQAKGMLMIIYGVDGDQAFDLLRRRSQTVNVKLRVLAEQVTIEFRALVGGDLPPVRAAYDEILGRQAQSDTNRFETCIQARGSETGSRGGDVPAETRTGTACFSDG